MFFDGWMPLIRVALMGTLAYVALVLLLRMTGKRTLSKLNAFDLVVTVALGSTLATVLLSRDVSLSEGVLALGLLIALQWGVTWLSVRSVRVARTVKAEPRLLFANGRLLPQAMKRERVTEDEVRAAMRAQGHARTDDVVAVIMETDGSLSVVAGTDARTCTTLADVRGAEVPP
jgi:uncharacterized membrane protein YcaP (DUF421 family)